MMEEIKIHKGLWKPHHLMLELGWTMTHGEGRRMCRNGGFSFDGEKILDPSEDIWIVETHTAQLGKIRKLKLMASVNPTEGKR